VRGGFKVECILEVSGGMLLGDEKGVKVPETGFDECICWHLFETDFVNLISGSEGGWGDVPHFKEDVSEFCSHFH
jgi:hypothetical protein